MLAKDGYVSLKQEAEDKWRWSHKTSGQKSVIQQNTGGRLLVRFSS